MCDFYEEVFEEVATEDEELEVTPLPLLVSKPRKKS